MAMDRKWWDVYGNAVRDGFRGERVSAAPVRSVNTMGAVRHYKNSGAAAISLAAARGAQRIILLGYDCQKTGGRAHWHGDHVKQLGNAGSMDTWPEQFQKLAGDMKRRGIEVVNASRATALRCFPLRNLEDEIGPDR